MSKGNDSYSFEVPSMWSIENKTFSKLVKRIGV